VPWGSAPSADLLNAFEAPAGVFEPAAWLIPRLISAGTLSVRNDLQYRRYQAPRPARSGRSW
jgi:hypothetical protein